MSSSLQLHSTSLPSQQTCCDDAWEAAYLRFETPAEEIAKFKRRLDWLGAAEWPRDAEIVEIFCGRGNGLHALSQLGFRRLEGVDLSARLLAEYSGPANCYLGDCRQLPFPDRSKDLLIVQGGLHHLPNLPDDLDRTLAEARRVLRADGKLAVVEPWLTPFLRAVHAAMGIKAARRMWDKLDALAEMSAHEATTYYPWLAQRRMILGSIRGHFAILRMRRAWGKLMLVGTPLTG